MLLASRTAYSMTLLIQVKGFLKEQFRLSDKKCVSFIPTITGGAKASEQASFIRDFTVVPNLWQPSEGLLASGGS